MVLEDITIKLIRYGGVSKPSYSITLKGNGELIYTGFENVKVKGKLREIIDEDIFLDVLSFFKEIDFFDLSDNYLVEKRSGRPYTNVSISIPITKDDIKTSSITHHDDDFDVPVDLIKLEKKIDILVNSEKWTKIKDKEIVKEMIIDKKEQEVSIDNKKVKESKKEKHKKTDHKKIIIPIIIVTILLIAFIIYFTQFHSDDKDTINDSVDYSNPKITFITTTSSPERVDGIRSAKTYSFDAGDTVYVDFELENIIHNKQIDINVEIAVSYGIDIYYYDYYINRSSNYVGDLFYQIIHFPTNNSWIGGRKYNITILINDKISDIQILNQTTFRIANSSSNYVSPLFAQIVNYERVSEYEIFYNGTASGGTGFYNYYWEVYDEANVLYDTFSGKSGIYEFDKKDIFSIKLIVDDGENIFDSSKRIINITT